MAKQIKALSLDTIGLNGLDTQNSATELGSKWLTKADNISFTDGGRVAFRKGLKQISLGEGNSIGAIHEHFNGTVDIVFASAADKIYTANLSDKDNVWSTYYTTSVSYSDWQFSNFNNQCLAVQTGSEMLYYETIAGTGSWDVISNSSSYSAPTGVSFFDPSCVLGFYGRAWAGGVSEEPDVLHYSNVLEPHKWNNFIDLKGVWGHDEIVAIKAFSGKLVIFGKENIVLYNNPDDISNIVLDEVIRGIGCVSRDSIQEIGDDIYFLSKTGVRSLYRTATLDKLPLTEQTITVKDDMIQYASSGNNAKSVYLQDEGFYIITFPTVNVTYALDIKTKTEIGTPRITRWVFTKDRKPTSLGYTQSQGFLIGQYSGRIAEYTGYYDSDYLGSDVYDNNSYLGALSTVWIDLGDGVVASILKKLIMVAAGGENTTVSIKIYTDFSSIPKLSGSFLLNPPVLGTPSLWGASASLYGTSKYTPISGFTEKTLALSNTAKYLRFELEGVSNGNKTSLQSLSLLYKQGKIR